MIVFYLKDSGTCMLSVDCPISDITFSDNKAYHNGEIINNNMTISSYIILPSQEIHIVDDGKIIMKNISELKTGSTTPSDSERIALLEGAIIELLGA